MVPNDSLPGGVVTFLFTDVQGSTRAWEASPELMAQALVQHDEAIMAAVTAHNGVPVKARGEGDSWFVVFSSARDAVAGAADVQRRLANVEWLTSPGLVVRASLHTGAADLRMGDYYGPVVNRAARLRAIAHGGQTLMSGATYELVRDQLPDGVSAVDLGEHGLKDLARPEHVYQLDFDDLPSTFPPLLSLNTVPNNLPIQLTEFIGRESELAEVRRLLGEHRFVTILASGGSGKTRLALQAVTEVMGEFPDGVFFIELAGITAGDDIVQAVAEALGLGLSSDEDRQTQLLTYLTGKRQLLVFDNFEHVRGGAGLITEILSSAGDVKVLTTSREKLNVSGETVFNLAGLDTTWDSPEQAFETAAVRLFLDGAVRTNAAFTAGSNDVAPLSHIMELTGGIPLAILLAAAWVDVLSVPEIADEIEKSLDFLETEAGGVPDRHRSVRAVFAYSWSLLSQKEQETFAALSVFRGGFTREAANQVAGASLRDVANFVGKSIVTPEASQGRYSIHELLRQYAETELDADIARKRQVHDAHAGYFADVVEGAWSLFTVSDQVSMLRIVEDDLDNARAAWRHYTLTHDAGGLLRLIACFYFVYEIRGWYPAAVQLFSEAFDAFGDSDDVDATIAREVARASRGSFLTHLGQPDAGTAAARAALANLPPAAKPADRWVVIQCLAIGTSALGEVDELYTFLAAQTLLYDEHEDEIWVALNATWGAFAAVLDGDLETADAIFSETIGRYESIHGHFMLVWAFMIQAIVLTSQGRTGEAIDMYRRQVGLATDIGYLRALVMGYEGLGNANLAAGDFRATEEAFLHGLEVAEQMGMVLQMLSLMTKIANARSEMGSDAEAVSLLATVCAHPLSEQQSFSETVPISEAAEVVLAGVRQPMDADVYDRAYTAGRTAAFDSVVNDLLQR